MSKPVGRVPGEVGVLRGRQRRPALDACSESRTRPLVERPVADDDVGHPGRDRHRGLLDGRARGAAAVVDPAEEREVAHAEDPGDLDLGVRVRGEGDEPVDLGGIDPGVGESRGDGLDRKPELGSAGLLRELGRTDAADRRRARERLAPLRDIDVTPAKEEKAGPSRSRGCRDCSCRAEPRSRSRGPGPTRTARRPR